MTDALAQEYYEMTNNDYLQQLFCCLISKLPGHDLSALGAPEALADRMIAALPSAGAQLASVVGPVYTSKGLERWLGISRQAISQNALKRHFLRLTTADGVSVFPSFQFSESGQRLPHLSAILHELAKGTEDAWLWATWLNTPDENGVTHADELRAGSWEMVFDLASEDAAAWREQ